MIDFRQKWRVGIAISVFALVMGGCVSDNRWTHTTRPVADWPADLRACQRKADRNIDQSMTGDIERSEESGSTYDQQMSVYAAKKERDRLVAQCMSLQGYQRK